MIDQFAAQYPFPLDEFQRDAILTLLQGDSVMVAAPTGSGKTVVAEFGIHDSFRRTGRVLYTTPIKALSNQKFRDLRATYGDDVGLLTGDVTENRDARVLVMTTEILRNMLLQSPWELDDVDCIVFDEIHYLADPERGTTWEESIILCPEHVKLICLSATVTNADEIAGWISRTHRPIRLISHDHVPSRSRITTSTTTSCRWWSITLANGSRTLPEGWRRASSSIRSRRSGCWRRTGAPDARRTATAPNR